MTLAADLPSADEAGTPSFRSLIPSERELALGVRPSADASPPFEAGGPGHGHGNATVRATLSAWLVSLARDAKPREALAGQSARPVTAIGGVGLLKSFAGSVKGVGYIFIIMGLGMSNTAITNIAIASNFGSVVLGLGIAYIADRVNRVVVIAIGALMFGLCMLYLGLEPSIFAVVVMTLGTQIFGSLGSMGAPEFSLLSDSYPAQNRGRIFALSASIGTIGAIVFSIVAGVLVSLIGWREALDVAGIAAMCGVGVVFVLREPGRGRWDLLSLGADPETTKVRTTPSFTEGIRTVQSVRTLRRICQAQIFLSASGVIAVPLVIVMLRKVAGTSAVVVGLLSAGQAISTLLGIQVGGIFADRYLGGRPGSIMKWLGYSYFASLASMAVLGFINTAYILVPVALLIPFLSMVPTTAERALISQVTPAQVRTIGIQVPVFYGLLGTVLILPFTAVLGGGSLTPIFVVVAAIGSIGGILYIVASVDVDRDMRSARLAVLAENVVEAAAREGRTALVVCRGVDVHYDGVQVLFGVDLTVDEGELVALLGTNGAGKSTLLRAMSGLSEPTGGAVFFEGRDVTHAPPHELAQRGVVQMPGGKGVFPALTVADNLRVAGWSLDADEADARIHAVYELFPALRQRSATLAGNLSGGEQQMVAVGQAMVMRPRILLIDELSLGLAPVVVEQLLQAVTKLHQAGTTIVLVEQSVDLALTVATRAVFMEKGEIRFDGPAADLRARPDLLRSIYIAGTRGPTAARRRGPQPRSAVPVLEAQSVSVSYGGVQALSNASVRVDSREIVGLIGPNGAGKTTLFDAVCGFLDLGGGQVSVAGRDVTRAAPAERCAFGLARSFQDARLFPALTVLENVLVAMHRQGGFETNAAMASLWLPQSRRAEAKLVKKAETILGLLGLDHAADKVPSELSTGTRRILDLACMLAAEPDVLLLDEPSSGIAQAEAEELGPLLDRIRRDLGCGILIIEHDMSLLTSVADRLVGMVLGETIVSGGIEEVTSDPRMVEAYLGRSERVLNRSRSTNRPGGRPAAESSQRQ